MRTHLAYSSKSTMKRNINGGKQTAKKLVNEVAQEIQENQEQIILYVVVFFLITSFFVEFGPKFINIIVSFGAPVALMAFVGLMAILSHRQHMHPEAQTTLAEELSEYIFRPSLEFQQAYPNYSYN